MSERIRNPGHGRTREDARKIYQDLKMNPKPDVLGERLVSLANAVNRKLKEQSNMRIPEYPTSEVEFKQQKEKFYPTKWWQAVDAKIGLLAETSDRSEFEDLNLLDQEGVTFRRLYEKKEMRWVDEHPFPEAEDWRTISEFPLYEIAAIGGVRLIETKERLQPTLIGDEAYLGFLLKKGMGVYLVGLHQLHADAFPESIR